LLLLSLSWTYGPACLRLGVASIPANTYVDAHTPHRAISAQVGTLPAADWYPTFFPVFLFHFFLSIFSLPSFVSPGKGSDVVRVVESVRS
jgi:hypothetical protein